MKNVMNCKAEIKSLAENGFFAGYASVFDYVDNQNDVIMRGSFGRSLTENAFGKNVKLLWQHDPAAPIGFFTKVKEDEHGLYVEGCLLLDVQKGREAYALLKSGAVEGLSIGYNVKYSEYDSKTGIRLISDLDLYEISLVTFPANNKAKIVKIKQEIPVYPGQLVRLADALDGALDVLR